MTEANFAVKQYQVHIDQFKDEVGRKIEAQPLAMQKEVDLALQNYLKE